MHTRSILEAISSDAAGKTGVLVLALLLSACEFAKPASPPASEQPGAPAPAVGVFEVAPESVVFSSELAARTVAYLIAEVRPQGVALSSTVRSGREVALRQGNSFIRLIRRVPSALRSALATLARDEAVL